MIDPHDVEHKKYPVDAIVFNNGLFSVAWGTWNNEKKMLGMRWNTSDSSNPADVGYPKTFGHPVWFMVPEELTVAILRGLLTVAHSDKQAIANILAEFGETPFLHGTERGCQ